MNTNPNAKTIVCYGDSNTWGANPHKDERHPANVRWVGVLQDLLGKDYEVINEGLCGRTFVAEDPIKPFRTGITHLQSILHTNSPIDIITVMLGTNDIKNTFGLTVEEIASHLEQTIQLIRAESDDHIPKIIVICPPLVTVPKNVELDVRLKDAPEMSRKLPKLYEEIAKRNNCSFLDTSFIDLINTDGYHLDVEHHKALGEKVYEIIHSME